jgi:hypothetical protein
MKIFSSNANQASGSHELVLGICPERSIHKGIVASSSQKANSNYVIGLSRRGRKAAIEPTLRHRQILAATKTHTYAEVGAKFNISRQRIAQIAKRWKRYLPIRSLPSRIVNETEEVTCVETKKENRIHIVSFRLTNSEVQALQDRYPDMKSVDRAARQIVTKFLSF